MKQLSFYNKNGLNTDQEVFKYFMETMIPTNRTWEYFINWDKVFNGADKYRNELMILNSLCGSSSPKEELKSLLKETPYVIKVFPLLLAVRDESISLLDSSSLSDFKFYDYDFSKAPSKEKEIDFVVEFFEKSGLENLIKSKKITNIYDYVIGVEAGLDSNGRKNRGGTIMESLVKNMLVNIYHLDDSNFTDQGTPKKVKELWDIDLPVDKTSRRGDFIVNKNNKIYWIETNFYSAGGSKLKSTAGEYKALYDYFKQKNVEFIWITDGGGWKSAESAIEETFIATDYIFNLKMIQDRILDEVFV